MASLVKEGYRAENMKNLLYTLRKIYQEVQFLGRDTAHYYCYITKIWKT